MDIRDRPAGDADAAPLRACPNPGQFSASSSLSPGWKIVAQIVIGSVWVFHGLYSKILNGIPRHRLIVAKILGPANVGIITRAIGVLEVSLGVWTFTAWHPVPCAVIQTAALVAMNTLEICLARELLISALGMVILNTGLLAVVWCWAVL